MEFTGRSYRWAPGRFDTSGPPTTSAGSADPDVRGPVHFGTGVVIDAGGGVRCGPAPTSGPAAARMCHHLGVGTRAGADVPVPR
jgi:hypothetical protein